MASVKLVLDTRSTKKDGTHPVKLYVTNNGDFYISTGISVAKEQWTNNEKKPTGIRIYDAPLCQMLTQARASLYQLRADGKLEKMSGKDLKKALSNFSGEPAAEEKPKEILIIDQFRYFIDSKEKAGTKSIYTQTLAKIAKYYDLSTLQFEDVTLPWLRAFDENMRKDNLSVNAISVHMRNLRSIFNRAIDDEIIPQNCYPFRKFKIKSERTRKRSLAIEQLQILRDYECQEHQVKYRDLFLLIFYLIGINMVDLLNLKSIMDGRIEFRRAKTGRLYSIKVEPEAMSIINKYRGKDYLLDVMDTYGDYKNFLHRMNKNLQEIGAIEMVANRAKAPKDVKKNKKKVSPLFPSLTTYWARHTWATIAAGLDIPKETIAAALGHGGDSVTDIYIDFDRKKVDDANRKVIDFIHQQ